MPCSSAAMSLLRFDRHGIQTTKIAAAPIKDFEVMRMIVRVEGTTCGKIASCFAQRIASLVLKLIP